MRVGNMVEWGQTRVRKQISVEAERCQGATGGGRRAQETFERLMPRGTFQEVISDMMEKQWWEEEGLGKRHVGHGRNAAVARWVRVFRNRGKRGCGNTTSTVVSRRFPNLD